MDFSVHVGYRQNYWVGISFSEGLPIRNQSGAPQLQALILYRLSHQEAHKKLLVFKLPAKPLLSFMLSSTRTYRPFQSNPVSFLGD